MSYTFRIVFSGLCAFVPDKPLASGGSPTSVIVLFRDLKSGLTLPGDLHVLPHFPMVEFNLQNRRPGSTRPLDSSVLGLCILASEDLTIGIENASSIYPNYLKVKNPVPKDPQNPTADEKESLFWLPLMENAVPGALVNPQLLGDLDPTQSLLAGRAFLTMGTLSTRLIQEGTWIFGAVGDPSTRSTEKEKYFSESLALEIGGLEDNVELSFKKFGTSKGQTLILGPNPEAPEAVVEVLIVNREFPEPATGENNPAPRNDLDFSVYYDLLVPPVPAGGRLVHLQEPAFLLRPGGCSPVAINS